MTLWFSNDCNLSHRGIKKKQDLKILQLNWANSQWTSIKANGNPFHCSVLSPLVSGCFTFLSPTRSGAVPQLLHGA